MPAFTAPFQPATTQLLLKDGMKSGVFHQENVFILLLTVSCCFVFFDTTPYTKAYGAGKLVSLFHFWKVPSTQDLFVLTEFWSKIWISMFCILVIFHEHYLVISIIQMLLKCCLSHPNWKQDSCFVQDWTWQEIKGQRQIHRASERFRHACWAWRNTQDELGLISVIETMW